MPYRIDIPHPPREVVERLTRLGALDVSSTDEGVGAILPDAVSADSVAVALGDRPFVISNAHGRDADSVWLLTPRRLRVGGLQLLGGDLLEQGVLHHFLREPIGQLERRHRQQLDRLLERRRQDELLRELCLELLRNGHGPLTQS